MLLTLPILVILLTGVMLTFPAPARSIAERFYLDENTYGDTFGDGVDDLSGPDQAAWPQVIARAQTVFPDLQISGLGWPAGTDQKVVMLRAPGLWPLNGTSQVHVTEGDGYMELRIAAFDLPLWERVFNLHSPLHKAAIGGRLYASLATIIGVGLICLAAIGLIAFVRSRLWPR